MGAIQGAKNQALFREAANERLRDLNEAFERELGETGRARRAEGLTKRLAKRDDRPTFKGVS